MRFVKGDVAGAVRALRAGVEAVTAHSGRVG